MHDHANHSHGYVSRGGKPKILLDGRTRVYLDRIWASTASQPALEARIFVSREDDIGGRLVWQGISRVPYLELLRVGFGVHHAGRHGYPTSDFPTAHGAAEMKSVLAVSYGRDRLATTVAAPRAEVLARLGGDARVLRTDDGWIALSGAVPGDRVRAAEVAFYAAPEAGDAYLIRRHLHSEAG